MVGELHQDGCRNINGSGPLLVTCQSHRAHCSVHIWNCILLIDCLFVKAKLKYYGSTHMSSVGKTFIVIQVLTSSLWYFIAVWVGSKRGLVKIKALLHNFLWYGSKKTALTQVRWRDCMMLKKIGGHNLAFVEDTMKVLMSEWIIQALLPNHVNMQILLRFRIAWLQPSYHGNRGPTSL